VIAVMLLYDVLFSKASWRERAPGYAAAAVPLLIFFYWRGQVLGKLPYAHFIFNDNPLLGGDFLASRLTAVKILGKYLWLLIWPQYLSSDYSYNQIPLFAGNLGSWEDWKAILALATYVGAAAAAVWHYRRDRRITFLIAFFLITIAPTSNVFIHIGTIMAERFLYLPSIAFAGCLVIGTLALGRRLSGGSEGLSKPALAALGLIALAFAGRTLARNADWHDALSLFRSAVRSAPESYKAHMSLAIATNDGKPENLATAISEIEKSMAILAPLPDELSADVAFINAGSYYRQKGDQLAGVNRASGGAISPEATAWYRKSLDVLLKAKRIEAATNEAARRDDLMHGRKVSDYGWYQLEVELGRTYLRLGQPKEALQSLEEGRKRRQDPHFWVEMAAAHQSMGNWRQGAVSLMEGLLVDPNYTRFAAGLVELYKQADPQGCAVRTAGSQTSLNVECPLVREDLCSASRNVAAFYLQINQREKALRTANTAMHDFGCPAALFR
jgi:tetratricopeptide (TPR) repeat protein